MPSNSVTFTRTRPPSSSVNTVSLASSMTGPSPSQMMQYQERSLAHHGMGMLHTRMEQLRVSHPRAAAATGVQPTPQSMIKSSQPSVEVAHSQVSYMDAMQLPNVYPQQQAQYMGHNTTEMQLHQASGHIEPSATHMIPHTTPPHLMHSTTSMYSSSQMHEGEMIH